MDLKCPSCGAVVGEGHRFCSSCGGALGKLAPLERGTQPIHYTPPDLTQRILASRDSMEGERKIVTVLFADIKDSTEAIEGLDPEEASRRFRPVLQAMLDGVHRYDGVVNRFLGDGIMALFGAPIAHEDHAVRACYAALAIRENLAALTEQSLAVRVGLNSGEVLLRSIGNDLSIDYDVVGSTVHLANRMEQLARPGTALLTEETMKLAEGFVSVTPLGPQQIRGISQPVHCYELRDSSKARTRWEIRSASGLSRFVGRRNELTLLREWATAALGGSGHAIEICGDPGIGKSRLLHELIGQEPIRSSVILDACGSSLTQGTPYWPVTRLLKQWFAIKEFDDAAEIRRKTKQRLASLGPDIERLAPMVESLLDLAVEDAAWKALDPPARRQAILNGLASIVARGAEAEPITLIFEDVQWFDAETLALLRILSTRLEKSRAVLLLTRRRDFGAGEPVCQPSRTVDLQPLAADEARQLLEDVAPKVALGAGDLEAVIQRAGGTPLFVEEIARSLSAEGSPARPPDSTMAVVQTRTDVPPAIRAIMAARLDRLAPALKHAVQVASVIGASFPLALVGQVLEASSAETNGMMEALQRAHILVRSSAPPDVEYSFFHSLMQEVAYGSLTQARRQRAHLAVVNSLEGLYGGRSIEHVETLQYHAAQSEMWTKAFTYACSSGRKALERCAFEEARAHFEKAVEFAGKVERPESVVGDHIDALLSLRNIYNAVGQYQQVYACLDRAEALAVAHRHASLFSIKSTRCQLLCVNGDVELAIDNGKAAIELASGAGNAVGVAISATILAWAYQLNGDYRRAVETLAPHLPLIRTRLRHLRVGTGAVSAFALGVTAESQAFLGNFAEARVLADEASVIAGETGHPYDIGIANYAMGHVTYLQGDFDAALVVLDKALAICLEKGMQGLLPWYYALIGNCHYLKQDRAKARDMLLKASAAADRTGIHFAKAAAAISLGLLKMQESGGAAGEDDIRAALAIIERNAYHGLHVQALRALVDIRLQRRQHDSEPEQLCASALKICDDYTMLPETAHVKFQLARVLGERGERDRSQGLLVEAHQLFGRLGMPAWQGKVDAFRRE